MVILVKKMDFPSDFIFWKCTFLNRARDDKNFEPSYAYKSQFLADLAAKMSKKAIFDQNFDQIVTINRPKNYLPILFFCFIETSAIRRSRGGFVRVSKSIGSLFSGAMTINRQYPRLKFSDSRFLPRYPLSYQQALVVYKVLLTLYWVGFVDRI